MSEVEYLDSLNQGFCICNVAIIISLGEQLKGWNEDYKGLGAVSTKGQLKVTRRPLGFSRDRRSYCCRMMYCLEHHGLSGEVHCDLCMNVSIFSFADNKPFFGV